MEQVRSSNSSQTSLRLTFAHALHLPSVQDAPQMPVRVQSLLRMHTLNLRPLGMRT